MRHDSWATLYSERVSYCHECGEPVWITRYGVGWSMTFRPGATVQVEVYDNATC